MFQDEETSKTYLIMCDNNLLLFAEGGGLRPPSSGKKVLQSQGVQSDSSKQSLQSSKQQQQQPGKQSMLQKFRSQLPNGSGSPRQVGLGKRTSSSSGFSSAGTRLD